MSEEISDEINTESVENVIDGNVARESVIRAVKFQVDAIVGEASLSLSELETLEGGSVIPLSKGINEVISLRLNNVEIARGELVSVDDKFAVKITHVAE